MRYDLYKNEHPLAINPDQILAMAHVATSKESFIIGIAPLEDILSAEAQTHLDPATRHALTIDAYMWDDGPWLLVNYDWNRHGSGVWLAPDGGWHFQPGEAGFYPWKEA